MNVINALKSHRSIRKYKPDPVPEEIIREILEAGIRASSSGNMQTYSIIVTTDRALLDKLYLPHMEQDMVLEAPVLVTFCADTHRMRRWLHLNDAPDGFDNFMDFMVAAVDAVLVSQNVAIAAESLGLGICYLGSTFANCDQVGEILNLPPGVVPVVGFTLGYPAEHPPLRDRLPYDALVHDETYQHYTDEHIQEVYRERDVKGWDRYMTYPRLRKIIEESGVENLAQVYSVVKYAREPHQAFSKKILAYLQSQDFMNLEF